MATQATGKRAKKLDIQIVMRESVKVKIKSKKKIEGAYEKKMQVFFRCHQSDVWVGFRLVLGRFEVELEEVLPSRLDPTLPGVAVL